MTCRRSQVRVLYRPPQKSSDFRLRIFCLWWAVQDENRAALTTPVGRVSNQPSGLLLSPRFPTHRNVYQERYRPTHSVWGFFVVTGQECKRAKAGYHRGDGILPFVFIQIDSTESQIGQTTKNAVSANIFQKGLTFPGSSI